MFRSIATVGGLTGLSRLCGLLREMLMSYCLGAGVVADAFVVAFKFPNFFRRFFAEGAFNAAFVPEFAGVLASEGKDEAYRLANRIFSWLAVVLCVFVCLVVAFAPFIVGVIAPGFRATPERLAYAVEFTRITFPYILCVSLAALLAGILNSMDRFAAAAATPIVLNVFMIAALAITTDNPGKALSYGVLLAGVAQLAWLYRVAAYRGFALKLRMPRLDESVKKILRLMVPGAIGAGVTQINIFIDMILASTLPTGSLAYLYYADRLNQLPLSIFGVAIGTVLLPGLAKAIRNDEPDKVVDLRDKSMRLGLRFSVPAALGLMALSFPLISMVYGRGHFTEADANLTAPALAAFALGLPAYVLGKIFTTCFFAAQDTRTPLKIGLVSVCVNLALNFALIGSFRHVGLALATGIAAWVQAGLSVIVLYRKKMISFSADFFRDAVYISFSSLVMAFFARKASYACVYPASAARSVIFTLGSVMMGIAVYAAVYKTCSWLDKIWRVKKAYG